MLLCSFAGDVVMGRGCYAGGAVVGFRKDAGSR
jgi:hypothetical protein